MKLSRLVLSSALVVGLVAPVSVAQAAPVTIATKAKVVKKCTLKKKASCKSKGVTKQKVGKKDLSGIKLSKGKVTGSKFTGTKLIKADFSGATVQDTTFSGANLKDANFKGATLKNVTFDSGTNLYSVDFTGAKLTNIVIKKALFKAGVRPMNDDISNRISGVKYYSEVRCGGNYDQHCEGVNFSGAIISGFQATGGDLRYADFSGATITNASLFSTDFSHANFTQAKISGGIAAYNTFNHAYFYKTKCNIWHYEENVSGGAFFGDSTNCSSLYFSGNRNPAGYGLSGYESVTARVSAGPFAAVFDQTLGDNHLKAVCISVITCSANLYSGARVKLTVWSNRALVTNSDDWTCTSPVRSDAIDYNAGLTLKTDCSRTIANDVSGSRTVEFYAGRTIRVDAFNPFSNGPAPIYRSIVIRADSHTMKTCSNASTCSGAVPDGSSVEINVTSVSDEVWISLVSPEVNDSIGGFGQYTPGVSTYHTGYTTPVLANSNLTFRATPS